MDVVHEVFDLFLVLFKLKHSKSQNRPQDGIYLLIVLDIKCFQDIAGSV